MIEVRFEEASHRYWVGGEQTKSVTQYLEAAGLFYYPDTPQMRAAKERGKIVHDATELLDKGTLDWGQLTDDHEAYVEQYQIAKHDLKFVVKDWEVIVTGDGYAGRLDRLATLKRRNIIIDLKTGSQINEEGWHHLQVAGYRETFTRKPEAYILYLSPGRYKWVPMNENAPIVWNKLMKGINAARTFCA